MTEPLLDHTAQDITEDLPPNIREILKRQPYVVVERDTEKVSRPVRMVMHLTDGLRSLRSRTLCGVRYSRPTHVPLTSWGNPDCEWCRNCMYSAKNSVKNQLKAQFAKGRESAKNTDPETGSAGPVSS